MATNFPVAVRVGAALEGSFSSVFGGATRQIARLGEAVAEVENRTAKVGRMRELQIQTSAAMGKWREAEERAKAYGRALSEIERPTAAQVKRLEQLREAADRARMAYRQNQQELARLDGELRRAGVDTERLAVEEGRLGQAVEKLRGHYARLGQAIAQVDAARAKRSELRMQMLDAVALGGALYGLTKPAIEFESVLGDIDKVVDFADGTAGLQKMGQALKEMSRIIPISQTGLAAIAAAGGRMGIKEGDLLTYTETVAKMAAAWEMPPDAAGEAMAKIQNVMGFAMTDLMKVGDAINKLDDSSAAKAPEILEVLKRISGTGKQFGMTTQELSALATTMLDLGRTPEVAATGINAMLTKLQAAPIQTKKFKAALKDLGYTAEGMQKAIAKDPTGTLTKFLEKVAKLKPEQRVNILGEMFGMEYSDDLAILVGGLDKYKQYMGMVANETNYAGSVQAEFEKRTKLTANQLKLLGNQTTELSINLGTALLPALNRIVSTLLPVGAAAADLAAKYPEATTAIVGTVAAAMGLKVLMIGGGYVKSFATELVALGRVARESALAQVALARMSGLVAPAMSTATVATRAFGLALLATPVGWVVAGVTAIAAVGTLVYKYWEPLSAYVTGVWDGVVSAVSRAASGIMPVLAPLQPLASGVGAAFSYLGDGISTVIGWFDNLLTPVRLTGDEFQRVHDSGIGLGDALGRTLVAAVGIVTAPMRALAEVVRLAWTEIQGVMSWAPGDVLTALWPAAFEGLGSIVEGARARVEQAWTAVKEWIGWDPGPTISELWGGMAATFDAIWTQVTERVGAGVEWIKSKLDWAKKAANWLTLGAFGGEEEPPAPPAKPGDAVNDNRPGATKVAVVVSNGPAAVQAQPSAPGASPPPSAAVAIGGAVARPAPVPPTAAPAPTTAAAAVAQPTARPAPAPQPLAVTVGVNIQMTAHPDLASILAAAKTELGPLIEAKVRDGVANAVREETARRAAALYDH